MEDRLSQVHNYWFGAHAEDAEVIKEQGSLWFGKNDQVDQFIREQFSDLVVSASNQNVETENLSPRLQLSVILLLDQFTRNIYRNDPRSFASDPLALNLAQKLIDQPNGHLRPIEKVFLYLPLEHSENLADQKKSVGLYRHLSAAATEETKATFASFLEYAVRHYDIIARFGRFPHRNKILGRISTDEELEFLSQPGSSF